jgi:thymidylate synthase ThyX
MPTAPRRIYLLDPQKLSPETIAVTFAKTSRSPEPFDQIAAELTEKKSAEFHEKWVVGYGHSSVAEHAILHIAVENVSRLAVENLESNRLASYTEKSTRYQKWDSDQFYIPEELQGHSLSDEYQETCSELMALYLESLPAVKEVVQRETPRQPEETEGSYERRIRSDYIDVCRYFLPASCLANVGVTINARALEHAISKMLTSPLAEVQKMGQEIKNVTQAEVPTLVKYANHLPYLEKTAQSLSDYIQKFETLKTSPNSQDWCRLVSFDSENEKRLLTAALYRFSSLSYAQIEHQIDALSVEQTQDLAASLLRNLGRFDIPLRELEHTFFTFDLTLDQGAYFELKRHRMMTQTPQAFSTDLGYALPRRMVTAGLESIYHQAMHKAQNTYQHLAKFNSQVAQYVLPNAFNRRVLLSFNLRTAIHMLGLRSAPNAHFAMRRVAHRIADEINACSPLAGGLLRLPDNETWQSIEQAHFKIF